jgi:hypothetical protein
MPSSSMMLVIWHVIEYFCVGDLGALCLLSRISTCRRALADWKCVVMLSRGGGLYVGITTVLALLLCLMASLGLFLVCVLVVEVCGDC